MADTTERRHQWRLRWITFSGWAFVVGMYVAAVCVAAIVLLAFRFLFIWGDTNG